MDLPDNIRYHIFAFFEVDNLLRIHATSLRFHSATMNNSHCFRRSPSHAWILLGNSDDSLIRLENWHTSRNEHEKDCRVLLVYCSFKCETTASKNERVYVFTPTATKRTVPQPTSGLPEVAALVKLYFNPNTLEEFLTRKRPISNNLEFGLKDVKQIDLECVAFDLNGIEAKSSHWNFLWSGTRQTRQKCRSPSR